jgi:hypothetical protein
VAGSNSFMYLDTLREWDLSIFWVPLAYSLLEIVFTIFISETNSNHLFSTIQTPLRINMRLFLLKAVDIAMYNHSFFRLTKCDQAENGDELQLSVTVASCRSQIIGRLLTKKLAQQSRSYIKTQAIKIARYGALSAAQ